MDPDHWLDSEAVKLDYSGKLNSVCNGVTVLRFPVRYRKLFTTMES